MLFFQKFLHKVRSPYRKSTKRQIFEKNLLKKIYRDHIRETSRRVWTLWKIFLHISRSNIFIFELSSTYSKTFQKLYVQTKSGSDCSLAVIRLDLQHFWCSSIMGTNWTLDRMYCRYIYPNLRYVFSHSLFRECIDVTMHNLCVFAISLYFHKELD